MTGQEGIVPEALSTLRGASVPGNARLIGRIAEIVGLVGLAALVVVFFLGGLHRNDQVDRLQHQGVPVTVTVTSCIGVAGGSGSTPATFTCQGSFTLDGQRHVEVIGGITTFLHTGTKVAAVTASGDPALLSAARSVATEHSSSSVYIVPAILLVLLAILVALAIWYERRRWRPGQEDPVLTGVTVAPVGSSNNPAEGDAE
jgi:hypothetical protein